MDTKDYYNTCEKCGRPIQYATKPKCNYCDSCMSEYCGCKLGRIKEIKPTCDSTAVIPSITVESVEGITNLANCLVHVNDINTTFYVDDKHRVMITWAGPVDIPGYDMENNPNGYRDQIVTDIEKGIAVIYDKHGKGYTFGIEQGYDITEIINNKLEQMGEDGELQDIIQSYLDAYAMVVFDTVADMKASTVLSDGSYAKTLGYYAKDDLGGAFYKIASTTPSGCYETLNSGLYAELVLEDTMNVKQFGAKGDGITDDTNTIQVALDNVKNIIVPSGTYMVDASVSIKPNTDNKIELVNDATIKAISNDLDTYCVVDVNGVSNVEIFGGTISGERTTHTGASGEWGHCVKINNNASEIYIHDINLVEAWGDGIYFNACSNVSTSRVHVNNVRRNGYSIISMTNYLSEDDFIENTSGTSPNSGVDIEPNTSANVLSNIVFNRLSTKNNANKGIILAFGSSIENTTPYDITFNCPFSDGDNSGVYFEIPSTNIIGNVTVNNPTVTNSKRWGIAASNYNYSSKFKIIINSPIIKGYATAQTTTNGGIYFQSQSSHEGGDVFIKNPIVTTSPIYSATQTAAITLTGRGASYPWHYFVLENPLDLGGLGITIGQSTNLDVTDKLELTRLDITANTTLKNDYHSLVTNNGASSSVRATIAQNTTVKNQTITFRVVENQTMVLRFTSQYIYPLSSSISQDVTLSGVGTSVTIKKISDTEWIVVNMVGNVTV